MLAPSEAAVLHTKPEPALDFRGPAPATSGPYMQVLSVASLLQLGGASGHGLRWFHLWLCFSTGLCPAQSLF